MSIFDSIKKQRSKHDAMMEKLRLQTEGINLRVTVTEPNYRRYFTVLVDALSPEDRTTLDALLTKLQLVAESDEEEITVTHIKNGKKVGESTPKSD